MSMGPKKIEKLVGKNGIIHVISKPVATKCKFESKFDSRVQRDGRSARVCDIYLYNVLIRSLTRTAIVLQKIVRK